jgi:very-short-patch-repair endonuclease
MGSNVERDIDYRSLYQRYVDGESGMEIAASVGIKWAGLYAAWKRHGWPMRSGKAAARLVVQRDPERARRLIEHATAVRRGGTDSLAVREARARTRELRQLGTSELEDRVAGWLDDWQITYVRQKAIGPYNVDFALPDLRVALDIDGGGHNPRVRANARARSAFIDSQGWQHEHVSHKNLSEPGLWQYLLQLRAHTTGTQSKVPIG